MGGSRKSSNVIRGDHYSEVTFRPPLPPRRQIMTGLLVRTARFMAKEEIVHVDRKSPLPLLQSHTHKIGLGPFKSLNFLGLEILRTANF